MNKRVELVVGLLLLLMGSGCLHLMRAAIERENRERRETYLAANPNIDSPASCQERAVYYMMIGPKRASSEAAAREFLAAMWEKEPDAWQAFRIADKIRTGKVWLGATAEQLRASWGKPERTHRRVGQSGVSEQWVYGHTHVFLDRGRVSSWSGQVR